MSVHKVSYRHPPVSMGGVFQCRSNRRIGLQRGEISKCEATPVKAGAEGKTGSRVCCKILSSDRIKTFMPGLR